MLWSFLLSEIFRTERIRCSKVSVCQFFHFYVTSPVLNGIRNDRAIHKLHGSVKPWRALTAVKCSGFTLAVEEKSKTVFSTDNTESRCEEWHRSARWMRGLERWCSPSAASLLGQTDTHAPKMLHRAFEKLSRPFAHPCLWARGELWNITGQISYRKISKCSKEHFIFSPISLESVAYMIVFSTYVYLFLGNMFWRNRLISATWERRMEFLRILDFPVSHEKGSWVKGYF